MPTISLFYGITIMMYYRDHTPPHFHARYQGEEASFTFDGELHEGSFPPKQRKLVAAWAVLNAESLAVDWELAREKKDLVAIKPL